MLKTTLIISTYNWPEALELVLLSVKNQITLPAEVIIADDGSGADTKLLIEKFQQRFPVPLKHVWHEDVGFTKSIILNKAIAKSQTNYIIQTDGDCILHPSYVKDHIEFAEKNTYLFGSRVNIQKNYLDVLFSSKQLEFAAFSKGIKKEHVLCIFLYLVSFITEVLSFQENIEDAIHHFTKAILLL